MADEKSPSGLAKAVEEIGAPFYRDAVAPSAKQFGTALETLIRGFNAALLPVKGFAWGAEQMEEFLKAKVGPKLQFIPPDKRMPPKPNVITQALVAVRFMEEEPDLQDMFAKLIASSIDERVASRAHPAFVEIIRQLTSDEAKILLAIGPGRSVPMINVERHEYSDNDEHLGGSAVRKNVSHFGFTAGCARPSQTATYINNLIRLGLLEPLRTNTAFHADLYKEVESGSELALLKATFESPPRYRLKVVRSGTEITPLGEDFYKVCIQPLEERGD